MNHRVPAKRGKRGFKLQLAKWNGQWQSPIACSRFKGGEYQSGGDRKKLKVEAQCYETANMAKLF